MKFDRQFNLMLATLILFLINISVLYAESPDSKALSHIEKGKAYAVVGDFEKAINEYLLALQNDSDAPVEVHFYLALAYHAQKDYPSAKIYLDNYQGKAGQDDPYLKKAQELSTELKDQLTEKKWDNDDPHRIRCIYSPTAFSPDIGSFNATAFNLGYWIMDYGISQNLTAGFHTIIPIGIFVAAPSVRFTSQTSPGFSWGFYGMGGIAGTYASGSDDHLLFFNGGPMLTIGNEDLFFNSYLSIAGAYAQGDGGMLFTPNIGWSYRFLKRVRFSMELYAPIPKDRLFQDENTDDEFKAGDFFAVLYGFRIFGEKIYGDINFVIPVFDESGEILKYMPLGIPLLTFGFQF